MLRDMESELVGILMQQQRQLLVHLQEAEDEASDEIIRALREFNGKSAAAAQEAENAAVVSADPVKKVAPGFDREDYDSDEGEDDEGVAGGGGV